MADDELVLVLTYRCNLNCGYCPTIKSNESMDRSTALRALELYRSSSPTNPRIKFFGGEPLLEYDLIRSIVNSTHNMQPNYELTTNGLLLDEEKMSFFIDNGFELRVSIDGPPGTQAASRGDTSISVFETIDLETRHYVIVNMVVSPKNVAKFPNNLLFLHSEGFSKFNILPAFFNNWSNEQLELFDKQLALVADYVKKNRLYIRNCDIKNESYLFNQGYVIDSNGDLYNDNRIMIRHYKDIKTSTYNIWDIEEFPAYIDNRLPLTKYESTNRILDSCITRFVNRLQM